MELLADMGEKGSNPPFATGSKRQGVTGGLLRRDVLLLAAVTLQAARPGVAALSQHKERPAGLLRPPQVASSHLGQWFSNRAPL